jgi:hypothetical protein
MYEEKAMNKIAFYGSIWSGDYQVVAALLRDWLKAEALDIKLRIGGEEIVYDSERLYLYVYNAAADEGVAPSFLLEGNLSGTLAEARELLQQLLALCKGQQIACNLEYVEVTENGDEVSEQHYLSLE